MSVDVDKDAATVRDAAGELYGNGDIRFRSSSDIARRDLHEALDRLAATARARDAGMTYRRDPDFERAEAAEAARDRLRKQLDEIGDLTTQKGRQAQNIRSLYKQRNRLAGRVEQLETALRDIASFTPFVSPESSHHVSKAPALARAALSPQPTEPQEQA